MGHWPDSTELFLMILQETVTYNEWDEKHVNQPLSSFINCHYSPLSIASKCAVYTLLITNGDSRSRTPLVRIVPFVGSISNHSAGSLLMEYLEGRKKNPIISCELSSINTELTLSTGTMGLNLEASHFELQFPVSQSKEKKMHTTPAVYQIPF